MENECTTDNFSLFAVFLSNVIKIGENLTKFWQKQFCTVFLDTVYMKWLELESERIITSQQLPFLEYIETHSEKWIRLFVFMSCFVNFYLFAIGYCNIHMWCLCIFCCPLWWNKIHLITSYVNHSVAFISHKQPGSSLTIPNQTVPCKLIVLWIADLLGNAVTSHHWWRYWNILNLQKQKWVCRL